MIEPYRHPDTVDTRFEFPLGVGAAISYIDDALPADLCDGIVQLLTERPHLLTETHFIDNTNDAKYSRDLLLDANNAQCGYQEAQVIAEYSDQIFEIFGDTMRKYAEYFLDLFYLWDKPTDSGYVYSTYPKNTGYRVSAADGGVFRKLPQRERVFTTIMFLNTSEEGRGPLFDLHDWTCPAVKGRMLFFPANFHYSYAVMPSASEDLHLLTTYALAPSSDRQRLIAEEARNAF